MGADREADFKLVTDAKVRHAKDRREDPVEACRLKLIFPAQDLEMRVREHVDGRAVAINPDNMHRRRAGGWVPRDVDIAKLKRRRMQNLDAIAEIDGLALLVQMDQGVVPAHEHQPTCIRGDGHELGEHGPVGHGSPLYTAIIRIGRAGREHDCREYQTVCAHEAPDMLPPT